MCLSNGLSSFYKTGSQNLTIYHVRHYKIIFSIKAKYNGGSNSGSLGITNFSSWNKGGEEIHKDVENIKIIAKIIK